MTKSIPKTEQAPVLNELVVVDWRGVCKNLSHSILSGAVACAYPTEPEEIGHRMAKWYFSLRADYPNANIVFANDMRPYWRHKFLNDWYTERKKEPIEYKGNRAKLTWQFATPSADMEALYAMLKRDMARSIGAHIIEDVGLEADDIWGILSVTYEGKVIGISADSDWRQTIKEGVTCYDFTNDTWHNEPIDIRVKWIGGDSGDNIKGCGKLKKDGTPAQKGWGKDGAITLLAEKEEWWVGIDPEELDRNHTVTTLPPPHWNLEHALEYLAEATTSPEGEPLWDKYGVTATVRAHLGDKAHRNAMRSRLRLHLLNAAKAEDV